MVFKSLLAKNFICMKFCIGSYSLSRLSIEILSGSRVGRMKRGFIEEISGSKRHKSIQGKMRRSIILSCIITMADPRHVERSCIGGRYREINHPYRAAHTFVLFLTVLVLVIHSCHIIYYLITLYSLNLHSFLSTMIVNNFHSITSTALSEIVNNR